MGIERACIRCEWFRAERNYPQLGKCFRMPQFVEVTRDHWCGEFKADLDSRKKERAENHQMAKHRLGHGRMRAACSCGWASEIVTSSPAMVNSAFNEHLVEVLNNG